MTTSTSGTSSIAPTSMTENLYSKNLTATTIKLNGNNYLLWTQSFKVYIDAQRKIKHLLDDPPNENDNLF